MNLDGFAVFHAIVVALVRTVLLVAWRIVAGVLWFAGNYPRLTAAVVGLWWVVEVAQ